MSAAAVRSSFPKGLSTLFFTEMWERFSYFGMRSILILYMISETGLGLSVPAAAQVYSIYTLAVYFTSIPGGYVVDKFIGPQRGVLYGGAVIAFGHVTIAWATYFTFFMGLALITFGTGLLKPSITTLVGELYSKSDERRDSGFSLFYLGINLGAFFAPFICGYLGQEISWHYGFAAAGIGMVFGLIQFYAGLKHFKHVRKPTENAEIKRDPLTVQEWKSIAAIFIMSFFLAVFLIGFEQSGSSLSLFAEQLTKNEIFGYAFPSSWLQSVNPTFILLLAPIISWIWLKLGDRQPSTPVKFSLGLFLSGLSFAVIAYASTFIDEGKISVWWLVALYFFITLGELCVIPVGLSLVTRLSPVHTVGVVLGFWFLVSGFGNYMAGYVGGYFNTDAKNLNFIFSALAYLSISAGVLLLGIAPLIKKLDKSI